MLGLVAVVAAVAVSLSSDVPGDVALSASAGERSDEPAEPPSLTPLARGLEAAVEPDVTREVASAVAATGAEGAARVTGTIVVRDAAGASHAGESGWVEFDVEGASRRLRAQVADGRFQFEVPRGRTVRPDQAHLGDRLTFLTERATVRVEGDHVFTLTARWPRGTSLHVLDAVTRRELGQMTVLRSDQRGRGSLVRPPLDGAGTLAIVERGASPIELPRRLYGRSVLWVGAPGYAWQRLTVDDATEGERQVLMPVAAHLGVGVSNAAGAWPDRPLALRLRSEAGVRGSLQFETPFRPDVPFVEIDALPPGPTFVTLEVGDADSDPFAIGGAELLLVAGARQTVTLLVDASGIAEAALAGTFELPPAWQSDESPARASRLDFRREGDDEARGRREASLAVESLDVLDARRGLRRFDAGRLAPGTYTWKVAGTGWEGRLVLPATGLVDAALVVPAPTTLTVCCVDGATGEPVEVRSLMWRPLVVVGERDTIGASEVVRCDPPTATVRMFVPPGRVMIHAFPTDDYGLASNSVQVPPEADVKTMLELPPVLRLTVRLRVGDTSVPLDGSIPVDVERVGGGGRPSASSSDGLTKSFFVDAPGRYTVDVGKLPGFLDPAPVEVHVDGATTEVVIELTAE